MAFSAAEMPVWVSAKVPGTRLLTIAPSWMVPLDDAAAAGLLALLEAPPRAVAVLLLLLLHAVSAASELHKSPMANLCLARMVCSLVMSSEMPVSRTLFSARG
jgi:hypothetical protein